MRKTSPSDAQRLDSAFQQAIDVARSDKSLGAGQRATAVHGLELERANRRWGIALFPAEPVSQVIAALQRDYDFRSYRLDIWQHENHPFADTRITQIGTERADILDYMGELMPYEIPGIYTQAETPEQLEALLEPAPTTGKIDYAALKERIDIVEYISRYVPLRKTGARYKGVCPFHQEKTASFVVYPETRSYYCFGCSTGGDVIDFAKRAHGTLPVVG